MKVTLTKGTNSVELDLDQDTVAALLPCAFGGLVITIGEPLARGERFVSITLYGYAIGVSTSQDVQKIQAIKAIRNATKMGLTEAKQATEHPEGKRLVVPEDLAQNLVLELRSFGYRAFLD